MGCSEQQPIHHSKSTSMFPKLDPLELMSSLFVGHDVSKCLPTEWLSIFRRLKDRTSTVGISLIHTDKLRQTGRQSSKQTETSVNMVFRQTPPDKQWVREWESLSLSLSVFLSHSLSHTHTHSLSLTISLYTSLLKTYPEVTGRQTETDRQAKHIDSCLQNRRGQRETIRGDQYVHWVMHKCIMVKVGGKEIHVKYVKSCWIFRKQGGNFEK